MVDYSIFQNIFQYASFGGWETILSVVVTLISLALITREIGKWIYLAFPVMLSWGFAGVQVSYFLLFGLGIVFFINSVSIKVLGQGWRKGAEIGMYGTRTITTAIDKSKLNKARRLDNEIWKTQILDKVKKAKYEKEITEAETISDKMNKIKSGLADKGWSPSLLGKFSESELKTIEANQKGRRSNSARDFKEKLKEQADKELSPVAKARFTKKLKELKKRAKDYSEFKPSTGVILNKENKDSGYLYDEAIKKLRTARQETQQKVLKIKKKTKDLSKMSEEEAERWQKYWKQ